MAMTARDWIGRIKVWSTALVARADRFIDERAEKAKAAWGASMEYKRRYTNPDEAKRARTPPRDLKL
jgi:hypothetical protein